MNERLAAAHIILKVYAGQSLSSAYPAVTADLDENTLPVIRALSYGCLRREEQLDAIVSQLLRKRLKKKDAIIEALLKVALFECLEQKTAEHAIVNETVKLVAKQRSWAKGLVNACLRRFIRDKKAILTLITDQPTVQYSLPQWLLTQLQHDWPQQWQAIAAASQRQSPMALRVNGQKTSTSDYLGLLTKDGIQAKIHPHCYSAIVLDDAVGVSDLPGFMEGVVSVQGVASQFAAELLDLHAGQSVLDACAAPGGKSIHILETADVVLTALDKHQDRLDKVAENLQRADKTATLIAANAEQLDQWWDGQLFDRILLDAPCSATGVISKHPDVKIHRRHEDIALLSSQQRLLLKALWKILAPGGRLLYSTCSILREENEAQISRFVKKHDDASVIATTPSFAEVLEHGWQLLPDECNPEGFYYAVLTKNK